MSASGGDINDKSDKSKKEKLVLRPEGTAGVLRAVLGDQVLSERCMREAVKVWYWGQMFRHERP